MLRTMLRDDQWARIEKLMQGKAGDRGRRGADTRLFVDAVLWVAEPVTLGAIYLPSSVP
jgi:hypothetical protein